MSLVDGLDADLREAARSLLAAGRIRAEQDAGLYRAAVQGRRDLVEFFRVELGWTLEVNEVAELVRLHRPWFRRSLTVRADLPGSGGGHESNPDHRHCMWPHKR